MRGSQALTFSLIEKMSLLSNIIIIISILIIVTLATVFGSIAPNYKSGGQSVCYSGYSLVNGECKANQFTACNNTSDCVPNLICGPDKICITPTPPTIVPVIGTREVIVHPPSPKREIKVEQPTTAVYTSKIQIESQSTDDERNSNGTDADVIKIIDIHSDETTPVNRQKDVSTPYQEQNGIFYCKSSATDGVIDAISYSTSTIFLQSDGTIIVENNKRTKITNNVILKRIVNFNNQIFGLSEDGILYSCHDSDIQLKKWRWDKVRWSSLPSTIRYINTPYNGRNLLVQDKTNGYIYNEGGGLVSMYNCSNEIRICGKDIFRYATYNELEKSARIYPTGEIYKNILDLAFNYHGDVVTIPLDAQLKYKRISMVNWQPYFIC